MADSLKMIGLPATDLARFFEQVALTILARNGDGHLKNYGVLYGDSGAPRLSPLYDVVTTAIYRYARFEGGPALEDRTLALRLFRSRRDSRAYPTVMELMRFGRSVCGVARPREVLERIAQGMRETLDAAQGDERIPQPMLAEMTRVWEDSLLGLAGL